MPDLLVSAATGALSPVLHKLAALLGDEYKRFKGVQREVEFLKQELEVMHAFLLSKSEEENPDAQDKVWMKEVRELSYDIEDSIDDFRVRVDDDSAKPDGFIDKCKKLLQLDKTKARRRIAKEIEGLKGQVMEVSERNQRYKTRETLMKTTKVTVDPRALVIFKDVSALVGINRPKQELISFLTKKDGDTSSQQPKIVSIVGIGGIGKTTLAHRVYEELNYQFKYQVWLSVSRNPDIVGILKTILIEVTRQDCYMTDVQQLIKKIKDILGKERYFIVVDDVWDVKTWDTIKHALPNNSCGSAIITTTRIHGVAKACCSLYSDGWVYQPKPLEEHDSKRLFQDRIFGPGNECPGYLKEVSDKILKKCEGLPLAIITISGLLASKAQNGVHSVKEWDNVQTSIGCGLERDSTDATGLERNSTVEDMMGILSLSYFDLPHHLKACLLYLSIFPEDYKIEKNHLVQLWVAEGFIAAESGEKSFNELINRSLILPLQIESWIDNVEKYHVHDTILDFIVRKSTEDNFVTVHGITRPTPLDIKVRRLSLQGKTKGDETLPWNKMYANVRSIVSFEFPCSLLGVRFLRVLDFRGCERLENHHLANIGKLLQLRYLGLGKTSITELPEEIGDLQYLETLDILECPIIQLPTTIVRLKKLVKLLMGPKPLNCFPSGIKNMEALEELKDVRVSIILLKEAAIFFEEIGDLIKMIHLEITLCFNFGTLSDEEGYMNLQEKMVSSFQRLNKLQTLNVQFLSSNNEKPRRAIFNVDDVILEVPWCSASLRILIFKMNPMSRVPSWMKSLVNMEELNLTIKKLDQDSLCILGGLPVLVKLILEILNNVKAIPSTDKQRLLVSNRHGYRSLREFMVIGNTLYKCSSIPMLSFEAGSMPKLEELFIIFDVDITVPVSNDCLAFGLYHLSKLTEVTCFMLGARLNYVLVDAAIKKEIDNHPNHPFYKKYHSDPSEGERGNRERLSASPVHTAQSTANLSEEEVVQEPADDVVIYTSGGDDKMSSSTTDDDNNGQSLSAAPPLPTDVSPAQKQCLLEARQGDAIHGRELVEGAPLNPDHVKGTLGSDDKTSSYLTDDDNGQLLTAALPLPTDLSFTTYHHSASPDLGRRHGQQQRRSKAHQGASIRAGEFGEGALLISDRVNVTSGAAPATSDVLGPRLIAAPQQQGAVVRPCFTFSSGSPQTAETKQKAMDCYKSSPSTAFSSAFNGSTANAFNSAFNGLSLDDDHPGSSATVAEAASSDTETQTIKDHLVANRIFIMPRRRRSSGRPVK